MAGAVLSAHEREEIRVGIEVNESLSDIARRLERLKSRSKATAFQGNESLARYVERRLIAKDSPTTIAIGLARAGGIEGDTVCAEPQIYRASTPTARGDSGGASGDTCIESEVDAADAVGRETPGPRPVRWGLSTSSTRGRRSRVLAVRSVISRATSLLGLEASRPSSSLWTEPADSTSSVTCPVVTGPRTCWRAALNCSSACPWSCPDH